MLNYTVGIHSKWSSEDKLSSKALNDFASQSS